MGRGRRSASSGELVVNAYSEKWLRRGFPWVYPAEVVRGGGAPGAEVVVRSGQGAVLGRALCDRGWIRARVYRRDDGPLDRAWLFDALDDAAALRDAVLDGETTGYRLVHGENDRLPGLRIDWWSHFAVVTLDAEAVAPLLDGVRAWLQDRRSPRGVFLTYRTDPRDDRDPVDFRPAAGWIDGRPPPGPVRVQERGLCFDVDPGAGADAGLYPDMRDVRAWLEPHWGGRRVCNTFAYTGAFSVAAAFHGASEVVSVDLSGTALERARANFRANGLDPTAYDFEAADTFKALDRLRRTGRRFDLAILDPPSFSRGAGVWSAKRDYPRLVASACRVLDDGGWLLAASNQGEVSPRAFRGFLTDGAARASCDLQQLFRGAQAADHPARLAFPESAYLKVGVYRVRRGGS